MFFSNKLPMTKNKKPTLKKNLNQKYKLNHKYKLSMMIIGSNNPHHHRDSPWRLNDFKSKNLTPFKLSKRL